MKFHGGILRRKAAKIADATALVLIAAVLAWGSIPGVTVFAANPLTDTSPNPLDVFSKVDGGVSHLIKKETVAKVTSLQLAAYYYDAGAGKQLHIRYGVDGKKCLIAAWVVNQGGNVLVTLTSGANSRTYKVPIGNVCDNLKNANGNIRNNIWDDGSAGNRWTGNKFFADYTFPWGLAYDAGSGRYKMDVKVEYGSAVAVGNSDENSVNFRANVDSGILAPLGSSVATKFGYRSAFFQDGNYAVQAATQFGIPCTVSNPLVTVKLYDPDVNVFGPTYMWVTENGVKLPKARYTNGNLVRWDSAEGAWESTGQSNVTSEVTVVNANKGMKYEYHIKNPKNNNYAPQSSNVLSVSIPYDSIYAEVDCNYSLTPNIRFLGANKYSYYPNLTVNGSITKTGGGPIPEAHPWEIYAVRYSTAPSTLSISGDTTDPTACNRAPAANRIGGCTIRVASSYSGSSSQTFTDTSGGPDAPGTRICYFTRIKNPTQSAYDDNVWRYSDMVCGVAGVTPKIRVTGFDAKVGSGIDTSLSYQAPTAQSYGSWGEYGVFSNGTNTNMASGSGLLGGGPNSQFFWSPLTFANTGFYGQYGGVTAPSFTGTGTPINSTLGVTAFNPGDKRVLQYDGDLYITGNLTYANAGSTGTGYASIKDIPEIKIIANNIYIAPNVTQIDPWLIARNPAGTFGKISTCSTVAGFQPFSASGLLNSNMCQNELKLNGPVIADQLYAYRTKDAPGDAWAENFDLRASNFLSSYAGTNTARPVARTELITELPPRF